MKTDRLDYELPAELIAQEPSEQRGGSRLLVLGRGDGALLTVNSAVSGSTFARVIVW